MCHRYRWLGRVVGVVAIMGSILFPTAVSSADQTQDSAPFAFGGGLVSPEAFEVTVFASGLPYPYGLAELSDGSLLIGTSTPTEGGYFSSSGTLSRLVDEDDDGVADGPPVPLYEGLPGVLGAVRIAGELVVAVDSAPSAAQITVLRLGDTAETVLTLEGALTFTYPTTMDHGTYGLAIGETMGQPGSYDLFFNVGSMTNDGAGAVVELGGLATGTLQDASIYRIVIEDHQGDLTFGVPELIATGLRNAAGIAIDLQRGDLIFEDNGIDTPDNRTEALSADEINVIAAADIGGPVEHFGFPTTYIDYRTGNQIGSDGLPPVAAFVPLNGSENEGPADIEIAPTDFPDGINTGIFIGFHGQWDLVGIENEENPVAYFEPETGGYTHVISNDEPGVGHLDGLLSTRDALYLADLSGLGSLVGTTANGVIYRVAVRDA